MPELIAAIASGLSTVITVIALCVTYYQTKKTTQANIIAAQRLEWAENVRAAVSEFLEAYYEHRDLKKYRDKIFLYLTPQNMGHTPLIDQINAMCDSGDEDTKKVVEATQSMVRQNSWSVKYGTGWSTKDDARRNREINKRSQIQAYNQTSH